MTKTEPTAAPMDGNVEAERAAIVAMLEKRSAGYYRSHLGDAAMAVELAIAAIQRGDHNGEGK